MDYRALAREFSAIAGEAHVTFHPEGFQAYAIDGKTPQIAVSPGDVEELSRILRLCQDSGAAVIPWGGGTKISLGNIPRACDVVVRLDRLNRIVEHDDANLTATVEAGIRLSDLQRTLGQRGQFLAIDAPFPERSTIGGIVATNTTGPRRLAYGGVRDLVIGIKAALPSGEVIKGGGKVVKNVAGYDMCKLYVGSLGTVGIITEVTFKMAPLPEEGKTLVAWGAGRDRAFRLVDLLLASKLLPCAVEVMNPVVTGHALAPLDVQVTDHPYGVLIASEGFRESVDRHIRDLRSMAKEAGLSYDVLEDERHRRVWEAVRNFGYGGGGLSIKVAVPISATPAAFSVLEEVRGNLPELQVLSHAASGILLAVATPSDLGLAEEFARRVQEESRRLGGHAVILSAPVELKARLDVWGEPPAGIHLMRRLKEQFDPKGILNPGRFVDRI
ncbi:MAG: FAD-binding oxidoreductase [Armatimonadota bacterium]|nr:FAD-binding oxidoreductase [Armatimonadota bacterium]